MKVAHEQWSELFAGRCGSRLSCDPDFWNQTVGTVSWVTAGLFLSFVRLNFIHDNTNIIIIIIIIDNVCIALFSDVHKLTALYNTLQHFLSENKIIKGNNVHESNTEFWASGLRLNFLRG